LILSQTEKMKMNTTPHHLGPADNLRRARLLDLTALAFSSQQRRIDLTWPDHAAQERAALNDWTNDGPRTMLTLAGQLRAHSAILKAGATTATVNEFQSITAPVLDRSLIAGWGGTSTDLDNSLTVSKAEPLRLSAFITVSDQLRLQNPLLVGAWIEAQLLSAIAAAIDKAALVGSGEGEPVGILADSSLLTVPRASAGVTTLEDLAKLETAIADAHGEADAALYAFLAANDVRETLRTTEGINGPIWSNPGPLGHRGYASPFAPSGTVILAQAPTLTVFDWGKLEIENLVDRDQAIEGFRTLIVTGYFDFAASNPNAVAVLVDPAE
jgi:HK97 family phage major capsid protein